MSADAPLRVIKLGGSLLAWPGLRPAYERWLAAQNPAVNVVVVGGGCTADCVRRWESVHGLSAEAAHWLSVRAMQVNTNFVAEILSLPSLAHKAEDIAGNLEADTRLVEPWQFLQWDQQQHPREALPASADVTSDSIAARVAALCRADELVLLKSCLPAAGATRERAAQDGYVDAYFPRAAAALSRVRAVNLRDVEPKQAPLP